MYVDSSDSLSLLGDFNPFTVIVSACIFILIPALCFICSIDCVLYLLTFLLLADIC